MGGRVGDIVALRDKGEQRIIGAGKGQEDLVRRGTPPGAVNDFHLRRLQKIAVLHQQIDVLDAEFDRKDPAPLGESMVGLVEPQKCRLADPIADTAIEQGRP